MKEVNKLKIIECPRDAMQGWAGHISTQSKVDYINLLLRAGFDTVDFGSFVSPKAIPQMADTKQVLQSLDLAGTDTKLLAIIANLRGAEEAVLFDKISYLGFPFSISETFQQKNTNSSISESLKTVELIQSLCSGYGKELVVYLSMGFGNPYGDPYDEDVLIKWMDAVVSLGVKTVSIADTVGLAEPSLVYSSVKRAIDKFPGIETGVHLHSTPAKLRQKLEAAFNAGCRRFDGAIKGIGGCPMSGNALVGNIDTEAMVEYFESIGQQTGLDRSVLKECSLRAGQIFI